MEDLLLKMMDHGYYVYLNRQINKYKLRKVGTPNNAEQWGDHSQEYDKLDDALAAAKQLLGIKDDDGLTWDLEVMYEHRGFRRVQNKPLGQVSNMTYEQAMEAGRKAWETLCSNYPREELENIVKSMVQARPAKPR